EDSDFRMGQAVLEQAWQECEVVVLDEHHRVLLARYLFHYCIGELLVDAVVVPPVRCAKGRTRVSDVAEGPQAFIRKAVVVAIFFLTAQPDPTKRIAWVVWRNLKAVT